MELRQLRYFVAVAEELHFARAAQRVGIEQSPLSRAIRDFELELGVPLFGRTSRRSWLLPAGTVLLEYARKILSSVDEANEALARLIHSQEGGLQIGVSPAINTLYLMRLLQRYRSALPSVSVAIHRFGLAQQITSIENRTLDLGIAFEAKDGDDVQKVPLWGEPLVVAIPRGHPHSKRQEIMPEDLIDEHCIAIEALCPTFSLGPLHLPALRTAPDLQAMLLLVAGGSGLGLTNSGEIDRIHQEQIVFRPLGPPPSKVLTHLLYSRSHVSPMAASFIECATELRADFSAGISLDERGIATRLP